MLSTESHSETRQSFMFMFIYIYICVCVCVCMCIYIYIYIFKNVHDDSNKKNPYSLVSMIEKEEGRLL